VPNWVYLSEFFLEKGSNTTNQEIGPPNFEKVVASLAMCNHLHSKCDCEYGGASVNCQSSLNISQQLQ